MTRMEVQNIPKAVEVVDAEWSTLRQKEYSVTENGKAIKKRGAWDKSKVMEYSKLKAEINKEGNVIHLGRVFDLCVEKGHELPEGHKDRQYKGRVVFGGKQCVDAKPRRCHIPRTGLSACYLGGLMRR